MALDLLAVSAPGLGYICIGGFVVAFTMLSVLFKERLFVNEVVLGTIFGIFMGPYVTGVFDPRSWGSTSNIITLETMRIVLAIGLFAIGVELPGNYMAKKAKSLIVMVVPTMFLGWVIVSSTINYLFPQLSFISCLVIAACLTPTDPIVCAAIVSGRYAEKNVPTDLRHILQAEAAANDGLAYPFLSISIYLIVESSRGVAIGKWLLVGCLYQVILGTVLGAIMGLAFGRFMKYAYRKRYIDHESYVAQYLALSIFVMGIASTIGSDDLLAVFAAGTAISWDRDFNHVVTGQVFGTVIDFVVNCACFVYIGAWLPFSAFNTPELGITPLRLIALFLVILAFRRIPAILFLYKWVPEIKTRDEAFLAGHFGPMGISAIFVSTMALFRLPAPHSPPRNQQELLATALPTIVAFVALGSILIHGLSVPFFSLARTEDIEGGENPGSDQVVPAGGTPIQSSHVPSEPSISDDQRRLGQPATNGRQVAGGSGSVDAQAAEYDERDYVTKMQAKDNGPRVAALGAKPTGVGPRK